MSKRTKPKRSRTQVKSLPKSAAVLTGKQMKKVKGGALGQQLDATSTSGGPTAAQNQKIQGL